MSIQRALYSYLTGVSAVSALVGTRIYTHVAPEGAALPRVTVQKVSETHPDHLLGASGLVHTRVQVDCWDDDADGVIALGDAIRTAVHGFRGAMGDESLAIRRSTVDTRRDSYEAPHDGSMVGVHRVTLDLMISHVETVPTF